VNNEKILNTDYTGNGDRSNSTFKSPNNIMVEWRVYCVRFSGLNAPRILQNPLFRLICLLIIFSPENGKHSGVCCVCCLIITSFWLWNIISIITLTLMSVRITRTISGFTHTRMLQVTNANIIIYDLSLLVL